MASGISSLALAMDEMLGSGSVSDERTKEAEPWGGAAHRTCDTEEAASTEADSCDTSDGGCEALSSEGEQLLQRPPGFEEDCAAEGDQHRQRPPRRPRRVSPIPALPQRAPANGSLRDALRCQGNKVLANLPQRGARAGPACAEFALGHSAGAEGWSSFPSFLLPNTLGPLSTDPSFGVCSVAAAAEFEEYCVGAASSIFSTSPSAEHWLLSTAAPFVPGNLADEVLAASAGAPVALGDGAEEESKGCTVVDLEPTKVDLPSYAGQSSVALDAVLPAKKRPLFMEASVPCYLDPQMPLKVRMPDCLREINSVLFLLE